jgi:hypothetical protein
MLYIFVIDIKKDIRKIKRISKKIPEEISQEIVLGVTNINQADSNIIV